MADVRPGPPQRPLATYSQTRSTYAPNTVFAPPAAPPRNAPPANHSEPRARHNAGPRHATGEWGTVPGAPEPARKRTGRLDKSAWHWLLLIPIVVPLMPVIYNRVEPKLLGLPFFYWGQLSFAFLASAVIAFVHRRVR
jgi:hypothetical protein